MRRTRYGHPRLLMVTAGGYYAQTKAEAVPAGKPASIPAIWNQPLGNAQDDSLCGVRNGRLEVAGR
jgi:hypothetical protein